MGKAALIDDDLGVTLTSRAVSLIRNHLTTTR